MMDYTITWQKVKQAHPELEFELTALQEVKETSYKTLICLAFMLGIIIDFIIRGVFL